MSNTIRKTRTRDSNRAAKVKITAELAGVSKKTVYRVIGGTQTNEKVFNIYMQIAEGENLLLKEVKETIAIN